MVEKKKESPIRKTTKNVLEIGVQSAVIGTLVPGAAAGVGQVYSGMLPVMTMKSMADEMEGGAIVMKPKGGSVVDSGKRLAEKNRTVLSGAGACSVPETKTVTVKHLLKDKNGHLFKPGDTVFVRHGTAICPKCGLALRKSDHGE